NKARALARGDANAATDRPVTIAEALDAYEDDLRARGRNTYNARWVRVHLPAHLAPQPLSTVSSKLLRGWRDGLIKSAVTPDTIIRVAKSAGAAFALAAKFDQRVSANTKAWREGLERLPDKDRARDAVLTEKQVLNVVSTAYGISGQFGLYVQ